MSRRLLVCDLDNTLYDWVGYFVPSFYAMVDEVVRITGCDRERLLDDFRTVHRRYHDSEHPFSLLETEVVRNLFPGQSRKQVATFLDPAFHAFNAKRKESLHLYPGVREALDELVQHGVVLVAHTESNLYAVIDRLTRLNLTQYFQRIFCRIRPDSEHPDPDVGSRWLHHFPMQKVVELSHHQRKPDPNVLLEICLDEGVPPKHAAYVGDSMARDMLMAKNAGVYAVWAKYGASHGTEHYQRLVRVTHWTEEDIVRERDLSEKASRIEPDHILEYGFREVPRVFFAANQWSIIGR